MGKLCPGCGATTLPGARFCRVCGRLLRGAEGGPADGGAAGGGGVSPGAKTVPLDGEGRQTKGIAADDPHGPVTNTSKVKREEMDELLRRARPAEYVPAPVERGSRPADAPLHPSGPSTNELKPPPETATATQTPAPLSASTDASQVSAHTKRTRRAWPFILIALALVVAVVAGLKMLLSTRRQEIVLSNTNSTPAPSVNDQKKLVDEHLADAEALLAAGKTSEAIARLRAAIELDPTNALAHRRLGEALEKNGERQAAIEEYRLATLNDQNDAEGWRALASAQLAESLFNNSVESYRRYFAIKGETEVDETTLDYAQALLLAGHAEEARAVYQRVAASNASPDLVVRAKRELTQIPSLPSVNANAQPTPREQRPDQSQNSNATLPQPTPTVQPTPAPTVQPTPAATPKAGDQNGQVVDPDSYYARGLSIISGRDLKSLPRAELLQALEYFQRAQGGTHRAEATRYVQQLGREYDRRKKQSQP